MNEQEILDTKLALLEAAIDDPITPADSLVPDDALGTSLDVAMESIGQLIDIYHTISQEGVSSHDIAALRSIQTTMASVGLALPTNVALESYDGMFTPTRSSLNLNVSTEAVAAEVWKTVKEWFFKLIDFVGKVIRWVKTIQDRDAVVKRKVDLILSTLPSAKLGLESIMKLHAERDTGRNLESKMVEISTSILRDPKLQRNKLMDIALGNIQEARRLKLTYDDVNRVAKRLLDDIANLRNVAMGKVKPDLSDQSFPAGEQIRLIADRFKPLLEVSTDEDYFVKQLTVEFWQDIRPLQKREVMTYEFIINLIEKAVVGLKEIKRFDDSALNKDTIDYIQNKCKSINDGIIGLEQIMLIMRNYSNCQFQAVAMYFNFYSVARDAYKVDIETHKLDDLAATLLKKLNKAWDELTAHVGL